MPVDLTVIIPLLDWWEAARGQWKVTTGKSSSASAGYPNRITSAELCGVRFVPLIGVAGWQGHACANNCQSILVI
ncbi:MAG: hypothetical protein A2091_13375 [Desulfuromonadales bacterium GWD2_61_12]|nr:MAG: hypothetical protein A2091_13375 [Desulfuromonadales bacterium GWD2_61_12]HAD03331.1 hypothetical protein [Desulfuromonas sp.]